MGVGHALPRVPLEPGSASPGLGCAGRGSQTDSFWKGTQSPSAARVPRLWGRHLLAL